MPLVGSTFGHELEYLRDEAWLADPGNPNNIKTAVEKAAVQNEIARKRQGKNQNIVVC